MSACSLVSTVLLGRYIFILEQCSFIEVWPTDLPLLFLFNDKVAKVLKTGVLDTQILCVELDKQQLVSYLFYFYSGT